MFFVMVSFGSGGVMKCSPYDGIGTSVSFSVIVLVYWVLLYLIEIAVFFRFAPLTVLWELLTGRGGLVETFDNDTRGGDWWGFNRFSVTYWRIPGCVLNICIVLSTMWFCLPGVYPIVIVTAIIAGIAHIPLIICINFSGLLQPESTVAEVVDASGVHDPNMYQHGSVFPPTPIQQGHIFGQHPSELNPHLNHVKAGRMSIDGPRNSHQQPRQRRF
jgi:hypothetical protein